MRRKSKPVFKTCQSWTKSGLNLGLVWLQKLIRMGEKRVKLGLKKKGKLASKQGVLHISEEVAATSVFQFKKRRNHYTFLENNYHKLSLFVHAVWRYTKSKGHELEFPSFATFWMSYLKTLKEASLVLLYLPLTLCFTQAAWPVGSVLKWPLPPLPFSSPILFGHSHFYERMRRFLLFLNLYCKS